MPTDKPRFTVIADDELLVAINRYQIRHHITSHTQAVRELLSLGILLADMDPSRNRKEIFSREEMEVLANYRACNPETKLAVRLRLREAAPAQPQRLADVKLPVHGVIELLTAFDAASPETQHYVLNLFGLDDPDREASPADHHDLAGDESSG